ncbi:hypothetical protein BS78_05G008200 [Paspalum vaginatum]|nr:hypothetical protein BS78_05G008200 [Paspalum vaginatum]
MMEVFALRPDHDGFRPVGIVAIFDGRRGQVIYRHDGHGGTSPSSKADLLLTGPYRAISADGCVAIEYSDGRSSSNVLETVIWDPYDDDDAENQLEYSLYDKLLTKSITVAEDRRLVMSYAVLSNAVEATVQVDLLLSSVPSEEGLVPRMQRVHGEITAHTQLINDNGGKNDVNSILLFRREMGEEALEVVQSTSSFAGSSIPLARSVLAWPCGSPLVIKVGLSSQGGPISTGTSTPFQQQGLECFSFDDHEEDKIYLSPLQGIGYVRVRVNVTGNNNWLPGPSTIKMDYMDLTDPVETDLLVIHPRQLRFTLDPSEKWMHCLLHITNDTDDERVAFRLLPGKESPGYYNLDHSYYYTIGTEVSGILPPNTTWTYLVRLLKPQQEPLANMDMILRSCVALEGEDDVDAIFQRAIEEKQEIDETTLKAIVCHPAGQPMTSSDEPIIQHGIKVIPGKPRLIDLHPTEPWLK